MLNKLFIAKSLPSSQVSSTDETSRKAGCTGLRHDLADDFRAPKIYFIITWDIKTAFTRYQISLPGAF